MQLKVKQLKFLAGRPVCMIHEKTAKEMSLHVGKRVILKKGKRSIIAITDIISDGFLKINQIAVSEIITKRLKLTKRDNLEVQLIERPKSINLIKKKLNGKKLEKKEINEIIFDIADNALTEVETAFFVSAVYDNGMSLQETKHLINAMVKSGKKLKLKGKIVDKHCIGGIAGNRTTPLVVAICSSTGLIMPKTSSRAITSAAGTADVIETIAKVDYPIKTIKKIIKKTNACMVWGGALGLAPVDDKIIKIERVVKIDSTAQLLASILSKKISVGSKYIVIDIPYGRSAKMGKKKAEELRNKFIKLGKMFDLKLDVILTDGSEPIGKGVGPVLELRDIFKILRRLDPPKDLEDKSVLLSGRLLELSGKAKKGQGIKMACEILNSGKAFKQFEKIIKAQEGKIKNLPKPKFQEIIRAKKKLKIKHIDNKLINHVARHAGCPEDKAAGIYLHKKKGEIVEKGQPIITIYATSKEKLKYASKFYNKNKKQMIEYR